MELSHVGVRKPAEPVEHAQALRQRLLHQDPVRRVERQLEVQVVDDAELDRIAGDGVYHLRRNVRVEILVEVVILEGEPYVLYGQRRAVVPLEAAAQCVGVLRPVLVRFPALPSARPEVDFVGVALHEPERDPLASVRADLGDAVGAAVFPDAVRTEHDAHVLGHRQTLVDRRKRSLPHHLSRQWRLVEGCWRRAGIGRVVQPGRAWPMRRRGLEARRPLWRAVGHQIASDVACARHHGSHHCLLHLLLLLYLHGRHLGGLRRHGRLLDRLVRRHERGVDDALHVRSGELIADCIRHRARDQVLDVAARQRPGQARGDLLLHDPGDLGRADSLRNRLLNRRHHQGVQLTHVDFRRRKVSERPCHDRLNL